MKKNLIFICDVYPSSFVKDEMIVFASHFHKIYVVMYDDAVLEVSDLPVNVEVKRFSNKISKSQFIVSLLIVCCPFFIKEILFVIRNNSCKHWWTIFKIQIVALTQARALLSILEKFDARNSIFYSYWHDYKAMALALMRKENSVLHCFARAHGWDVFAERQNPPYLPFKKFIIENLSQTISISEAGKKAFEQYLGQLLDGRVVVSRLGKFNDRKPLLQKTNNEFVICSCSNLIPVKRIDKIITMLASLQTKNVTWVHFGDGPLRDRLQEVANNKLSHIHVDFKGMVSNEKILDFYAEQYVDLFVNLSDSEGIPVSIMEALSAGIPVMATNVGGTSECVNEGNGFIIDKTTPIDEIANVVDTFFASDKDIVQHKRAVAYDFWKNNYEAGKNYRSFIDIITQ